MRKSKSSNAQIIAILKQNENGVSVPELCREHRMSSALFINSETNTVGWMYHS